MESNVLLGPDQPALPARSVPHRSTVRVGEFEVAMGGGVWVATRVDLNDSIVAEPGQRDVCCGRVVIKVTLPFILITGIGSRYRVRSSLLAEAR